MTATNVTRFTVTMRTRQVRRWRGRRFVFHKPKLATGTKIRVFAIP